MAAYPGSVAAFGSKSAGDTIQPAHINDLQNEISAIESGILNGTAPFHCSNATLNSLSAAGSTLTTLNVTTSLMVAGLPVAGVPIGAIFAYCGVAAPTGFLLCDGSAVSRGTYADLFAVLGTTYGAGDGSTTFNLPDLRQRFPLGKAASGTGNTLGATGGAIDHTHTYTQVPNHVHTITDPGHTHDFLGVPGSYGVTNGGSNLNQWYTGAGNTTVNSRATGITGTNNPTGGVATGATASGNPPYLVLQFIVKT